RPRCTRCPTSFWIASHLSAGAKSITTSSAEKRSLRRMGTREDSALGRGLESSSVREGHSSPRENLRRSARERVGKRWEEHAPRGVLAGALCHPSLSLRR